MGEGDAFGREANWVQVRLTRLNGSRAISAGRRAERGGVWGGREGPIQDGGRRLVRHKLKSPNAHPLRRRDAAGAGLTEHQTNLPGASSISSGRRVQRGQLDQRRCSLAGGLQQGDGRGREGGSSPAFELDSNGWQVLSPLYPSETFSRRSIEAFLPRPCGFIRCWNAPDRTLDDSSEKGDKIQSPQT